MAGLRANGSVTSLDPPRPKSPPGYADLYGKRRELAKVQVLEREIGFLEEELKSVEKLQPASRSCKEVADFVTGNVDPLILTTKKTCRSCRFWKWLCGFPCFKLSWICCCSCPSCPEQPDCFCDCTICNNCSSPCANFRMPDCNCCSCWNSQCFKKNCRCSRNCCIPKCQNSSCFSCSSIKSTCVPNCPKICTSSCCYRWHSTCCYLCY